MTDVAHFLTAREQVAWHARRTAGGGLRVEAAHPSSLARQTWRIDASRYTRPVVREGEAVTSRDDSAWWITAKGGSRLVFDALAQENHPMTSRRDTE